MHTRPTLLALLFVAACDDRSFTPIPVQPADPDPPGPNQIAPDWPTVDELAGPPRLGLAREVDPPATDVCPQRRRPGEALAHSACIDDWERPDLATRVLWDNPEANRAYRPEMVGLPPHANAGLSDRDSLLVYPTFDPVGMRAVHPVTGEIVWREDGKVFSPSAWHVNEYGQTWIHALFPPVLGMSFDGTIEALLPRAFDGCNGAQFQCGLQQADLDFDGHTELLLGGNIFNTDFTIIARGDVGMGEFHPGYFDINGDGHLEVILGSGIMTATGDTLCEVDPDKVYGHVDGGVILADLDGDEWPEVIVQPKWQRDEVNFGQERLRVQDTDCNLLFEVNASDLIPGTQSFNMIVHVAPFFEVGKPAFVAEMFYQPDPPAIRSIYALFDHNLEFKGFSSLIGFRTFVFDHDGDGIYGLFGGAYRELTGLDDAHLAPGHTGLFHFDARTGETTTLIDDIADSICFTLDPTGEGHARIFCQTVDQADLYTPGKRRFVAFESDGIPWAPAYRFHHEPLLPYLYTPDGHFAETPVSWKHTGMYRASPTGDPWTGRNADLIVRILDVCDTECDDGWWTLWPQVGNQGDADVLRPLQVLVYGVRDGEEVLIGEQTIPYAQRERWMPALPIRVPADDYTHLRAVVTGDDWDPDECDRTNNTDTWELVCP